MSAFELIKKVTKFQENRSMAPMKILLSSIYLYTVYLFLFLFSLLNHRTKRI